MQSSHLFTFDVVVTMTISLLMAFSEESPPSLLRYIFKFKFLRNSDVAFVLDFICTSRTFLWAFSAQFWIVKHRSLHG